MRSLMWSPKSGLIGSLFILTLLLSGCAPDANAHILSPGVGEILVMEAEGQEVVFEAPEPPPLLAELSEEEIFAGLPEEIARLIPDADTANGENLAVINACIGCHQMDRDNQVTAPTWYNVGNTAVARQWPNISPALYLYDSIANPDSYVVDGYPSGLMVQTFAEQLSDQDFADLIAYLLEQQQGQ